MKFKLEPGTSVPDTLHVEDFTTTTHEIKIRTIPDCQIPVKCNILGKPVLTLREYPETVTYINHWRTIEVNTLEDLMMIQNYLGDIRITHEPCTETGTEYSIYTIGEYD